MSEITLKEKGEKTLKNELRSVDFLTTLAENPKNKRRSRNKIVVDNDSFELVFDTVEEAFKIAKKDDFYFSIIPYDTSRKYIQLAVFLYLKDPQQLDDYLERHQANLLSYLLVSLYQVTGENFDAESLEVEYEMAKLKTNLYFKIQVVGRLMQHDETGPLSATLPYKFLYDLNEKTGIHGYIDEFIKFIQNDLAVLPLQIESHSIYLLEDASQERVQTSNLSLTSGVSLTKLRKSDLTMGQHDELSQIRKNYRAQSTPPQQLKKYFVKANTKQTSAKINVVSDLHATRGKIELKSPHFNIIAGDLSNSYATDESLNGIAVIGNHDILECALEVESCLSPDFIKALTGGDEIDYSVLRIEDATLYTSCQQRLTERYPSLIFLNNQSYYKDGIRYIGLSLPVSFVKQKKRVQAYLTNILSQLFETDQTTPTIIISHAPLFSELSLLSRRHKKYHRDFICVNDGLKNLFRESPIIGVIHGHHHIPASSGVVKRTSFAGKELFVICSIYSELNQGFDLQRYLQEGHYLEGERND